MKLIIKMLSVFVMVLSFVFYFEGQVASASQQKVSVNVDGSKIKIDAVLEGGRTYVPIRDIAKVLPTSTVDFDTKSNVITLNISGDYRDNRTFKIYLSDKDKNDYIQNTRTKKTYGVKDAFPKVKNGTTYISLVDIASMYDAKLDWNGKTSTAYVLYKGKNYDGGLTVYMDNLAAKRFIAIYQDDYQWNVDYYDVSGKIIKKLTKKMKGLPRALAMTYDIGAAGVLPSFRKELDKLEAVDITNGIYFTVGKKGEINNLRPQTPTDIK